MADKKQRKSPVSQAAIERVIRAAEKTGIEIGAVEVTKNGSVRILTPSQVPSEPIDEFGEWEKQRGGRAA